jgi:hypothetical protein
VRRVVKCFCSYSSLSYRAARQSCLRTCNGRGIITIYSSSLYPVLALKMPGKISRKYSTPSGLCAKVNEPPKEDPTPLEPPYRHFQGTSFHDCLLKEERPPLGTVVVSTEGLFEGLPDYLPSISSPSACAFSLALTGSLERT